MTGICWEKLVSTVAADGLAPFVTKPLEAAFVLTMYDKRVPVLHEKSFSVEIL